MNSSFGFDFGDMCAPFVTHAAYVSPRTEFSTTWIGVVTANTCAINGTATFNATVRRQNTSVTFAGLPSPATKLEIHKASMLLLNGTTKMFVLAGTNSLHTCRFSCPITLLFSRLRGATVHQTSNNRFVFCSLLSCFENFRCVVPTRSMDSRFAATVLQ